MKLALATLFVFLLQFTASAHVGETLEECTAAYGKPLASEDETTIYVKDGFRYICQFYEQRCVSLLIFHEDGYEVKSPKPIKQTDISRFLKDNAGQQSWRPLAGSKAKMWVTAGGLAADYESPSNGLLIYDTAKAEKQKVEKQKVRDKERNATAAAVVLPASLTTGKGKTFTGVHFKSVEPDGIKITHDGGIAKIFMEDLPENLRAQYHFDESEARTFRDGVSKTQGDGYQKRMEYLEEQNRISALNQQGLSAIHSRASSFKGPAPASSCALSLKAIKAVQKDLDGQIVPLTLYTDSAAETTQEANGNFQVYTSGGFVEFIADGRSDALALGAGVSTLNCYGKVRFGDRVLIVGTGYDAKTKSYTWGATAVPIGQ